jgi:glucosamine--fructose-6-phosphate aminotransferase (isomerizing)
MCGIFGLIVNANTKIDKKEIKNIIDKLFILSEARGKESAGLAVKNNNTNKISVFKKSIPASQIIIDNKYLDFFEKAVSDVFLEKNGINTSLAFIGHARLVTNGSQENNNNNQPVISNNAVAVHNGIITNVDVLWEKFLNLKRKFEVDTEIALEIFNAELSNNNSINNALKKVYELIEGSASLAIFHDKLNKLILSTNTGSLYYSFNKKNGVFVFASEEFILDTLISDLNLNKFEVSKTNWLKPGEGIEINTDELNINHFNFVTETNTFKEIKSDCNYEIVNFVEDKAIDIDKVNIIKKQKENKDLSKLFQLNTTQISYLKRCSKCLLPETFPFIIYDSVGECNYCKNYVIKSTGGREQEFKNIVAKYKKIGGIADCIVPFSGGRDSSFGLHYIVHELNLKPITYTFDWGMVTDLARRNIARLCGKLGVENIIVSADIAKKRNNIRLNVEAWLKNPKLGMIPLFMAGDKQFIYYANQIRKQTGIELNIYSSNMLENTDFKVGFCGIPPSKDKSRPDHLPFSSKVNLAWYYGKNFLMNPAYINSSVIDTLGSFYSYYAEPRTHFFQVFDWIKWDEKLIEKTLFEEYNWEMSPDTTSSWRIGDGTAAFYNYIYYTVAGFSEFDTFRSNQIREGLITREEGLKFIAQENNPRFDSMKWYFDTIGVDMEQAIKVVNKIPKLYTL